MIGHILIIAGCFIVSRAGFALGLSHRFRRFFPLILMGVPALEALAVQTGWYQAFWSSHAALLSFGNATVRVPIAILMMGAFALGGLRSTGICEIGNSISLLLITLSSFAGIILVKVLPETLWPATIFPAFGAAPVMLFTWRVHWLELPPKGVKNRARSYRFQMRLLRRLSPVIVGIIIGCWGMLVYKVLGS